MRRNSIRWTATFALIAGLAVLGREQVDTAQAFVVHGDSWASTSVNYRVNPNFTDAGAGTTAQQIAVMQRAASEWTSAAQIPFQFLYTGTTTTSMVAPTDGTNAVFFSEIDGGGALATATWSAFSNGNMFGFDIQFYTSGGGTDFVWALDPSAGQFDIESVAVHEFGHALGMGHSNVPGATMFPSVSAGSTANRTLAADDIAGVQSIYGVSPTGAPTIASLSPFHGWINGGERVTVTGTNLSGSDPQVITVDGIPATEVTVISQNSLSFVAPSGLRSGFVDVSYSHQQGNVDGGEIYFNTSMRFANPLQIGGSAQVELLYPDDANRAYKAGVALGFQSGIPCAAFGDPLDPRVIPINEDVLFLDHQDGLLDDIFVDFNETLDFAGQGFLTIDLPNLPFLQGYILIFTSITIDPAFPSTVKNIGNALAGVIQ